MVKDERDTSAHIILEVAGYEWVEPEKPIEFGEVFGLRPWVKLDATS